MRRAVLVCALTACVVPCVLGDPNNVIVQRNGDLQYGTHYTIDQDLRRVNILLGVENTTFEFEAGFYNGDPNDPNSYVEPGDIDYIGATEDAGPVTITIVGQPGHAYGARDVGQIDLSASGVTGTIDDITLSRDLGTYGPVEATTLSGHIDLGETGVIADDMHFTTVSAWLVCATMRSLTVDSDSPGAEFCVNGSWGRDGLDTIWVDGSVGGFYFADDVSGDMTILGDVGAIDFESAFCDILEKCGWQPRIPRRA
jgi:hypothetical protein